MSTREELLLGVTKVNHERIDLADVTKRGQEEVHADGNDGRDQSSGDGGTRERAVEQPVQRPQESVGEFISRRKGECELKVEEVSDQIAINKAILKGLYTELAGHNKEIGDLTAMEELLCK